MLFETQCSSCPGYIASGSESNKKCTERRKHAENVSVLLLFGALVEGHTTHTNSSIEANKQLGYEPQADCLRFVCDGGTENVDLTT